MLETDAKYLEQFTVRSNTEEQYCLNISALLLVGINDLIINLIFSQLIE